MNPPNGGFLPSTSPGVFDQGGHHTKWYRPCRTLYRRHAGPVAIGFFDTADNIEAFSTEPDKMNLEGNFFCWINEGCFLSAQ